MASRTPDPEDDIDPIPPQTMRRMVRAGRATLMAQEAAAQVKNDVYARLKSAHYARTKLPSKQALRNEHKQSPSSVALGRAKQVQYAIDDAYAMFASFRSNLFAWVADHSSRSGKPRPPRYYKRGQRATVRYDYQDFSVTGGYLLTLPPSSGLGPVALVERDGRPLLRRGDRLVAVCVEPCRSRRWVSLRFVIRRAKKAADPVSAAPRAGSLLIDVGVKRLVTCLDEKNLIAFFVSGGIAKAILQRGAKWHARLSSAAKLGKKTGVKHGKRRARQLSTRSARQMEDLMKKVARMVVCYAETHRLKTVAVGRNVDWKQNVDMGAKQNQLFTFIPHAKLIAMIKTKCLRAGIEFIETEESFTSKTDHLAGEEMGPKPEGYQWLGSRTSRGCFRSSRGISLQADVNGCIGIGIKVGGKGWLEDFIQRLGASPGARLVPRNVHVNGVAPAPSPGPGTRHQRLLSPRTWISTQVALVNSGLIPAAQCVANGLVSGQCALGATPNTQRFPAAA